MLVRNSRWIAEPSSYTFNVSETKCKESLMEEMNKTDPKQLAS